jgi:hypothetical protein
MLNTPMPYTQIPKELLLQAIEKLGPVQPIDLRKELRQGDTVIFGALLSELLAQKKLALSNTRRGGGPFYYDPAKPESLETIAQYLNEKDRRTCALLKERKVLREDEQEPLVRVGLQMIPDFSRKMTVQQDGKDVAWWRYYLVPEDEAKDIILGKKEKTAVQEQKDSAQQPAEHAAKEKPEATPVQEPVVKKERKKRAPRKKLEGQTTLAPPSPSDWLAHDTLWQKVQEYAQKQKLSVSEPKSIKANSELSCTFVGDGQYGKAHYHVIAFNKRKITEKDLTQALLAARGKGMPLLILSVEEIPVKTLRSFEMPNVYVARL